jgi:spermidine synthase
VLNLVYALTFVLAACSLIYELAIAQAVSLFAVNNVVWYSLTIGIFIGSMGIGASLSSRLFSRQVTWARLIRVEVILSAVGGMSVVAIHAAQSFALQLYARDLLWAGNLLFFGVAFLVAAAVGVLTGAELPLLIDIAEEKAPAGSMATRVLGMDYLGSLAGAVLFPTVLLPHVDMLTTGWLIALVNLAAAGALAWARAGAERDVYLAGLAAVASLLVLLLANSGNIGQYFLQKYYYYAYPVGEPRLPVRRVLTPYQAIDIVRFGAERDSVLPEVLAAYSRKYTRDPQLPRGFGLYLNNDFQFYADVEEFYHETFAHAPIAAAGQVPRRVLVMGAGDGLLLRELVKYPGIKEIVMVEIDPGIVRLFRTDAELQMLTRGAFGDPRLRLVYDDAYHYIRTAPGAFDAVFLDFPAPMDFSLSKLYSREFYAFVRKHLAPGGFLAMDAPALIKEAVSQDAHRMTTWNVLSSTLQAAGFEEVRPFLSRLEDDNPRALEILRSNVVMDDMPSSDEMGEELTAQLRQGMQDKFARDELKGMISGLVAGFIFARATETSGDLDIAEISVEADMINQPRARLAFGPYKEFPTRHGTGAVNSIFRPRLPSQSDWWKIRTPY